ncbi:hypothetical protein C7C56_011160 [Massilia glaciei]|uniref:HTH lysR-type domain-containing protein n=2 Tax=Massilia glaciei TaxID=1524097 RepID=A0A2U2HM54_9BURK|nr:hypothetical protein C7C56_011160 [Massilia glaciei]
MLDMHKRSTQSPISDAITELEETLGAKLLLRSRGGCAPTEAGHRALGKARPSLALHAPVDWAQLKALPYIQFACPGALAMLDHCRAAGFTADVARTVATESAIAAMVGHGTGYSILPRLAVSPIRNRSTSSPCHFRRGGALRCSLWPARRA